MFLWMFILSTIFIVLYVTWSKYTMYENFDSNVSCNWISKYLDGSPSYDSYYNIVNFLTSETNDIQTRASIKYNVGTVFMDTVHASTTFPTFLMNPQEPANLKTVSVTGQVPNIFFNFSYPPPLKGPVGIPGNVGETGMEGIPGPQGPIGPPGYKTL